MKKDTVFAILAIAFVVLAFGIVGEIDYQDAVAAEGARK